MDLPSGTPRRLTTDTVHEQVPVWSPDGAWLAYVTWSNAGGSISKVRSDGHGAPVRLTTDPAFYDTPVWSPDGQRIVAVKGPRSQRLSAHFGPGYELVWLPAAGGAPRALTPADRRGRAAVPPHPDAASYYTRPLS